MDKLTYLSIDNLFWIRFEQHQINFGFKGMPADVHFTIAFNGNSKNVNLHLSRNVTGIDLKSKARIDIATISEEDLESFGDEVPFRMLRLMLVPFDIQNFREKYADEISYLSHADITEHRTYPIIQQQLSENLKKISCIKRKTRLKIHGDIGETLLNLATSPEMQNHVSDCTVELPNHFEKHIEGGMLITKDGVIHVTRHDEMWYQMREDIKPIQLLEAFVDPVLVRKLVRYTKRSMVRIKNAKTIDDTSPYNSPTHLLRMKKAKHRTLFRKEK